MGGVKDGAIRERLMSKLLIRYSTYTIECSTAMMRC
jgi:hypothetical protein